MLIDVNNAENEETLLRLTRMQYQAARLGVGTTTIGRYEQIANSPYGVSRANFSSGVEFEIPLQYLSSNCDTFLLCLDSDAVEFDEVQGHLDRLQAKADEDARLAKIKEEATIKVRAVLNDEELAALGIK
jgi:hypothetical protein